MKSFETVSVNPKFFFNMALAKPIVAMFLIGLVSYIFWTIYKWATGAENAKFSINILYLFFSIFKTLIYAALFLLVFFYDFSTRAWFPWIFQEEMPLSSAFVGVLAAYEAISGLIGSIQAYVKIASTSSTRHEKG